jgi:hypothetical protein
MKKKLFSITTGLLNLSLAFAQLTNNGANIVLSQNTYLVLGDMSLVNNGTFNQTAGTVKFIGSNDNTIAGSTFPKFFNLEINKTGGAQVQLQSRINIAGEILFSSGLLNLNNNNIILTGNAILNNENENNHIIGTGGYVEASANLSAPNSANPGNLGAIISSPQNLGATTIRRGHQVQTIGSQSSVRRYFDINPSINSLLNATLRFTYLDAELNGLNENTAFLWKSTDNINWSEIGFDNRNITSNYVEKIGIADFSRWTLTGTTNPCETMQTFYADADNDGYGNFAGAIQACTSPAGYVSNSDDCNDNNASVYPGAMEVCNGIDDNCNAQVDEGCGSMPSVNINDIVVYESQGQVMLTVTLSNSYNQPIKINYKTIDGTAVSNGRFKDYKAVGNGSITISAGNVSGTIAITIYTDNITEPNEYFDIQLTKATNANLADNMGRVTIIDGSPTTRAKTTSTDKEAIEKFSVQIHPNPSRHNFALKVESNNGELSDVRVLDIVGRLVKQMKVSVFESTYFGSDLKQGVYIVEVRQGKNLKTIRLIKL